MGDIPVTGGAAGEPAEVREAALPGGPARSTPYTTGTLRRLTRADRRLLRNAAAKGNYAAAARITGRLTRGTPGAGQPGRQADQQVEYRTVIRPGARLALTAFVVLNALTGLAFIGWLLLPQHVPGPGIVGLGGWRLAAARGCLCLVVLVEVVKFCQNLAVWVLVQYAKDPVPLEPAGGLRIALITTLVPSKEPLEIAERTLRAMTQVRCTGPVDVWVLDEEDSPEVREMAARLGVRHFTRKGRPGYNQASGAYRARTKSGNHNAWRSDHEWHYDVVGQMDPDHVPLACFLERTVGYFRDPDTAFVVAPQVYGNMYDTFVARGASVQQYLFSAVIERAGNGLGAPLLIGTNHLYRPAAWRQIGGYQDSVTEDHLTGMRILGTENPATGRPWRGVYTPDVLAIGEGPTTWTDYFNQQKRWAYGIWEIKLRRKLRAGIRLGARQRMLFGLVQYYYPSAAVHLLLGCLATVGYLLIGVTPARLEGARWLTLWAANLGSWFLLWAWLQRFNLAAHERRGIGAHGIALALFAGPVYVGACVAALLRRPLSYAVTAKGALASADSLRTFRLHLLWAAGAAALLTGSLLLHHGYPALRVWVGLLLLTGLLPPLAAAAGAGARARARLRARIGARVTTGAGVRGGPGAGEGAGTSPGAGPRATTGAAAGAEAATGPETGLEGA